MNPNDKLINSSHILICRTDNIGDVVLTLPMARRLRELNPDARISMLCRSYAADVVRLSRNVDDVIALEDISDDPVDYMRQAGIDTVILAQPHQMLAKAAFRAGVRHRIGNSRQKLYLMLFCNRHVRFSKRDTDHHEAQINFEFLRPYGARDIPRCDEIAGYQHFSLPRDPELAHLLAGEQFNLIFHPYSNGHGREWPLGNYTELARLLGRAGNVRIWLTGSAEEGQRLREQGSELLAQPYVHNVCGRFSLQQLAIFIDMADGLVASGTGPLHLSGALGQRTLGLFPPTRPMHPGRWAALGKRCTNLCGSNTDCPDCASQQQRTCRCMDTITPRQVEQVVAQWQADAAAKRLATALSLH